MAAQRASSSRGGEVGGVLGGGLGQLQLFAPPIERFGQLNLCLVDGLAGGGAFLLGKATHLLEQTGELAVGAEVLNADIIQASQTVGGLQRLQGGILDRVDLVGEGHSEQFLQKEKGRPLKAARVKSQTWLWFSPWPRVRPWRC